MLLPDPTSSWLFKPINSRSRSKNAMFDEHPSLCELWPKLLFSLTEELSPKACQSHKFAKTGRYASEEENGEDMCQIQAPISFREFKKIVWERAIRNSAS